MDHTDRNIKAFKASIVTARTRRPVLDAKAIEALKSRAIVTAPDAELDRSAYLSEQFFQQREISKTK